MNEIIRPHETEIQPQESRFGNRERITEILRDGEIVDIVRIEDIYPELSVHENIVEVANIKPAKHKNINEILGIRIQKGKDVLQAIFKPANGESAEVKNQTAIHDFYPHECAAFIVSDHFGFDIVPPTIIRDIEGEGIGALQLFLDHNFYQMSSTLNSQGWREAMAGQDHAKIALLDWILANCDRRQENILVSNDDPTQMVGIDHGIILSTFDYYSPAIELRGPSLVRTYDNQKQCAKHIPIQSELIDLLKSGYERKNELTDQLKQLPDIKEEEIELMWRRASYLISLREYLSKANFTKEKLLEGTDV